MFNQLKGKFDSDTFEFLKHGKNYLTGSIFVKGLSIISIPIMTRLLTASEFGLLSVFTSIVTILSIIYGLGTQATVSRYFFENKDDFSDFLGSNFIYLWCVGGIAALISFGYKKEFSELVDLPDSTILFLIVIAFTSATYNTVESYLQVTKNSHLLARISILRGIFSLIVTISITYYLSNDRYLGTIYSLLLFSSLFFIYSLYLVRHTVNFNLSLNHIKYSFILGIPVIFHIISGQVINSFDQIMINNMIGAKEVGLYSFAYKIGMIFQMILVSLTQSWTPIFFENLKNKSYANIENIGKKYSIVVSALALILVILSPYVSQILAPDEYSEAISIIPIIIIGFLFQFLYLLYVGYAFYAKKNTTIALITMLCSGVNIYLNYIFIPIYGYMAAAWTTLITFLLFFSIHYLNICFIIKPEKTIRLRSIALPVLISISIILLYLC